MGNYSIEVLESILQGKTLIQIMSELKISYRLLLRCISEIIECGYDFDKKIFANGNILYSIKEELEIIDRTIPKTININFNEEDTLRVLFISDLHIGSKNDRLDCVERASDYAIAHKINYIINVGDFIENIYTKKNLRLSTIEDQIGCIVEKYPCDRRLNHIVLYGNHDYHFVPDGGIDVATEIERLRPDIFSLGYGRGYIAMKDDRICLEHECYNRPRETGRLNTMKFIGHSHIYKVINEYRKLIYVPALSDETPTNYSMKPLKGFLDVTFHFGENGNIIKVNINHFVDNFSLDLSSKCTLKFQRRRKQSNL